MAKWYVNGSYMTFEVQSADDVDEQLRDIRHFQDYDLHSRASGPTSYAGDDRVITTGHALGYGPYRGSFAFLAPTEADAIRIYNDFLNRPVEGGI